MIIFLSSIHLGCTEFGGAVTHHTKNCKHIDSAGTIIPNAQIKIIDLKTGQSLGCNQDGEICLKSSRMMMGYYKNPTATKEAVDKEGNLFFNYYGKTKFCKYLISEFFDIFRMAAYWRFGSL